MTLFILLAAATLYAAYRLRLNHLLELERQRTRIAMDLHDEIGSGLGSIGILSGILASDALGREDGRRMAGEIAATTGELGASLRQIVWTLDPRVRTMEELARRLAEQGRRLFSGDDIEFTTYFPGRWPDVRPSQLVRRNVVLIGLEALYNAARHARAQRVDLRLLPQEDRRWELTVADDGAGFRGPPESATGRGLRSARRRAEEIGADLECSSAEGGGTVVRLIFRPVEPSRRLRWARRFFARSPED
jgi:signal transduction histidine kinase